VFHAAPVARIAFSRGFGDLAGTGSGRNKTEKHNTKKDLLADAGKSVRHIDDSIYGVNRF